MSRTLSSARLLVWLLASTSGTLAACSRNAANSEVVVTIEAEPGVRAAAMLVVVRVFGGPHGADQPSLVLVQDVVIDVPPHNGWPLVIALAPLNRDPTRIYRVEALAYDVAPISDDVTMRPPPVATVRAVRGYAPGQTVLLSLLLQDSCLGHPCDEFQTCDRGTCAIARMIDPSTLPLAGDAGPRPDGGPGQDGGPGPDVGPGPDAGDGGRIGPDAAPPCTMASCNDGLSCTVDFCALDGCQHMPIAALCNDGVVCTDDLCNGTTGDGCTHPANTVACDDGVFCNGLDTCGGGTCSVHAFTLPATVCGALSCDGTRCTGCGDGAGSSLCRRVPM